MTCVGKHRAETEASRTLANQGGSEDCAFRYSAGTKWNTVCHAIRTALAAVTRRGSEGST